MGAIRVWLCLPLGFALGLGAARAQTTSVANPKLQREYAKLEAKAAGQKGSKQAETLAKMAEMNFNFAHASYAAEQPAAGERDLDLAQQQADSACALLHAEAHLGKTNGMQKVEESLQKITYGLRDLAQDVHFRQRPKVVAVGDHFADLRAQLLQWMFDPKPKQGG